MKTLKRILRWVLALAGLAVFCFLFGVALVNWVIMPRVVGLGREVEAPDVGGRSLGEAVMVLRETRLDYTVKSKEFDPLVPEGYIVSQDPPSGRVVKEGRKVSLVVSLGPEKIAIPHLEGLSLQQATSLLKRSGLVVGDVSFVFSDSILPGRVIASSPPFDSLVKRETEVELIVSKEEKRITMPNLMGDNLPHVEASLKAMGLFIGEVREVVSGDVEKGTILLQFPQPGAKVEEGDTIRLVVSVKE